jgi:protein-tyrosine phosphatase
MCDNETLLKWFPRERNLRELGGIPAEDGRHVRHGLLYRCGGLYHLDPQEIANLNNLHLKTVLDLRTSFEAARKPDPKLPGAAYLNVSGVLNRFGREIDFSPVGMRKFGSEGQAQLDALHSYYVEMPFDNAAFHLLFEQLQQGNAPLLFHCASGKDRTGVAALLVLKALGVSDAAALADYMRSNWYREKFLREEEEREPDLLQDPVFSRLMHMQQGVVAETGTEVLAGIRQRSGSYDSFFQEQYGLDQASLAALRNRYLES